MSVIHNWDYANESAATRDYYDMFNQHDIPEVYEHAAREIEQRGWTKGSDGWRWWLGGPVCIEGAIHAVLGVKFVGDSDVEAENAWALRALGATPLYTNLHAFIKRTRVPGMGDSLYEFNDTESRDQEDITATLREAANGLRNI